MSPSAEAVGVEPESAVASVTEQEPADLVMLTGTVRVFGQEEVTLAGVSVCEETTTTCTTTDGNGAFELFAPNRTDLVLVATGRDIFASLVPLRANPDIGVELRVVGRTAGDAFVQLADGELRDDTGMIFVDVRDAEGTPLPQMWLTIRDFAAWGPIFTSDGIVPDLDRKLSGDTGFGAYLELPEGFEEVGVGRKGLDCSAPLWPKTSEGLYRVPVRGESITWLTVVCE